MSSTPMEWDLRDALRHFAGHPSAIKPGSNEDLMHQAADKLDKLVALMQARDDAREAMRAALVELLGTIPYSWEVPVLTRARAALAKERAAYPEWGAF